MELRTRNKIRFLALFVMFIALFSITIDAYAHIPCMCNNAPDQCVCFIQLGDKGLAVEQIIYNLKNNGYIKKPRKKTEFTLEVKEAVLKFQADHNLKCTGWMDDETLDALLFNILPDPSVKYEEERWRDIVFVPTDGGKRYHLDPHCCDMHHPRMITRVNAEKLGISHCGLKSEPYASDLNVLGFSSAGLGARILPDEYYIDENSLHASALPVERSLLSDNTEEIYIGNKNSHVFHKTTCSSAKSMSAKNKIEFTTRDEAIEKGYKPCSKCNP